MIINKDNYEQFFLDHVEGNLSPEMERELMDFLDSEPGLRSLLDEFDNSPLPLEETPVNPKKKSLKKYITPTRRITENNIDEWLILEMEGVLDEDGKKELQEFLALNQAYGFDRSYINKTRLAPDLSISFPGKNKLKKKVPVIPIARIGWIIGAAAAVVLLFLGIRFFNQRETGTSIILSQPVAEIIIQEPQKPGLKEPIKQLHEQSNPKEPLQVEEPVQISRAVSFRIESSGDEVFVANGRKTKHTHIHPRRKPLPAMNFDIKDPSLASRVFNNLIASANDRITRRVNTGKIRKPELDFWSIAKAGVVGFNSLSDRDLQLDVQKDAVGRVKSYALLEQERLIWSRDLKKD